MLKTKAVRKANANEIIPGLWIGDCEVAIDDKFFSLYKIKAVLNCTPDVPAKYTHKGVEYMRLTLDDQQKVIDRKKMDLYLPAAVEFIHKNLDIEKKRVLVHCHMGISRSSSAVAGYLMKYRGMSYDDAFNLIVKMRPQAFFEGTQCNFEEPLKKYEKVVKPAISRK